MINMSRDVSLIIANYVLISTFIIIVCQLVMHCFKEQDPLNHINPGWIEVFFINLIFIILLIGYLTIIVIVITQHNHNLFNNRLYKFDDLFELIKAALILQLVLLCSACLLWCFCKHLLVKKIPAIGLFTIIADNIGEAVFFLAKHPTHHWVQSLELLLKTTIITIIPIIGIFTLLNMHRITYKMGRY